MLFAAVASPTTSPARSYSIWGTLEVVERVPYTALPEGERTEAVELVGESNRFVELLVAAQGPASEFEPPGIAELLEA